MISGTYVINNNGENEGRFAYFTVKGDPDNYIYLVNAGETECTAMLVHKSDEEALKANLTGQLQQNKGMGLTM